MTLAKTVLRAALMAALFLGPGTAAVAQRDIGQVIADTPDGAPIHLIFVHGIRVDRRGSSLALQGAMCKHITGGCPSSVRVSTDILDLGQKPDFNFAGELAWKTDEDWRASQPVVDHYVYRLASGKTLIVDEVNWWRVAFPLKCRFLVARDTRLIGANVRTLELCANLKSKTGGGYGKGDTDHHAWIDGDDFLSLKDWRPPLHGAPLINRYVKAEIFDWGLVEAVLALGVTKTELRKTVRCAMTAVAAFDPSRGVDKALSSTRPLSPPDITAAKPFDCNTPGPAPWSAAGAFIVTSHSLGSFLLLDTFAAATGEVEEYEKALGQKPAAPMASKPGEGTATLCRPPDAATFAEAAEPPAGAAPLSPTESARKDLAQHRIDNGGLCFVIKHSDTLYFFANQIPLLEIGRMDTGFNSDGSPRDMLGEWAKLASQSRGAPTTQIVAFNEPGDALTFPAPDIQGAKVINMPVHNATHWLNLLEDPTVAHDGYFTNPVVLKTMFGR